MYILVINLGSTSSKIAVYDGDREVFAKTAAHQAEALKAYRTDGAQLEFRKQVIFEMLSRAGFELSQFSAVCSRGGPLGPVESGTYRIDKAALKDALNPDIGGRHPSCLGVVIAYDISEKYNIPAYFVDPVSTDELIEEARVTGLKGMERISMFHALNQKAAARRAAAMLHKPYEDLNLIGVHMGGGVSVAAHRKGRVIDNYNVIDEGCFSMDRGGSLPTTDIVNLCFSGADKQAIKKMLGSEAGVYSYLKTKDFKEVEARVKSGDTKAARIFNAMVYQHVKCIGAMAAAMHFEVDAVFLTGGIAYSAMMCGALKAYIDKLAPVIELPGENEMKSLAEGVMRVMRGESAKSYEKALKRGDI